MSITITAFARSPDGGRGLARDMRVRWALKELGLPYDVRALSFDDMKTASHLALHPFGQIPTYEDDEVELFEPGAIVLHLAERHPGLLPESPAARSRAIAWIFAAVNTVELPILELANARLAEWDKPWTAERLPLLRQRVHDTLARLSAWLGQSPWLEGTFSAGDLMMASVLLRVRGAGLLEAHANLAAYVERAEARPAYQRAFDAQRIPPDPPAPGAP